MKKNKDLDSQFKDNPQIQAVLNNNWLRDGSVNPFFGKELPQPLPKERKRAKKDRRPKTR